MINPYANPAKMCRYLTVFCLILLVALVIMPFAFLLHDAAKVKVLYFGPNGNTGISMLLDFDDADQVMIDAATWATLASFKQSYVGATMPKLQDKMFTEECKSKVSGMNKRFKEELEPTKSTQDVIITKITILTKSETEYQLGVRGRLQRVGTYEKQPFVDATKEFKFRIFFKKNPDFVNLQSYPLIGSDVEYEIIQTNTDPNANK